MRWIKSTWREFWKEKITNQLLVASAGLYLILWLLVIFMGKVFGDSWWSINQDWLPFGLFGLPPEFPLFYSLPRGQEQLAVMNDVWQIMAGLGLLLLIDYLLAMVLIKRWRVLSHAILWTAVLSVLLLGFSFVRIYLLVG